MTFLLLLTSIYFILLHFGTGQIYANDNSTSSFSTDEELCAEAECSKEFVAKMKAVITSSCDQCFSLNYSVCTRYGKVDSTSITFCDHDIPSLCTVEGKIVQRSLENQQPLLICSRRNNAPALSDIEIVDVNADNFSLHVPNALILENFNRLNITAFKLRIFCPRAICTPDFQLANETFLLKEIDLTPGGNFTYRRMTVNWTDVMAPSSADDNTERERSVSIDYYIEYAKSFLAKAQSSAPDENSTALAVVQYGSYKKHSEPVLVDYKFPAKKSPVDAGLIVLLVITAVLVCGMLLACLARRHAARSLRSRYKRRTADESILVTPCRPEKESTTRFEEEYKLLPMPTKIGATHPADQFRSDDMSPPQQYQVGEPLGFFTAPKRPTELGVQRYEDMCQSMPSIAIPAADLDLLEIIGQGRFGPIKRGYVDQKRECMVHCAKAPYATSSEESKVFLEHLDSSIKARSHPNVILFVGVCGQGENLFVAMQLENGQNLRSLLRESRTLENFTHFARARGKISLMSSQRLISIMLGVARGMMYLEENKVLHDNLAAVNVLIGENGTPKIAGFGMATISDLYKRQLDKEHKPLRWMPPETLRDHIFSLQSQIWSFGVLLWEIITLGGVPYFKLDDDQVVDQVSHHGLILHKPVNCGPKMYDFLAGKLFQPDPELRPHFAEILRHLHDFNIFPESHVNLDLTEGFVYEPVKPVLQQS